MGPAWGSQDVGNDPHKGAVSPEIEGASPEPGFLGAVFVPVVRGCVAVSYKQAARRSFEDACVLHDPPPGPSHLGSLGTPDHLFGLAAECALKAILMGIGALALSPSGKPPLNFQRHVDLLWNEYPAHVGGRTALSIPANPFRMWTVHDRYEEDATFTEARVAAHRRGAEIAMAVLEQAIVDGVVA